MISDMPCRIKTVTAMGFEPTDFSIVELESTPLHQSGTLGSSWLLTKVVGSIPLPLLPVSAKCTMRVCFLGEMVRACLLDEGR